MNFLLFAPEELQANATAIISGNRTKEVQERFSFELGASIPAGVLNGKLGQAKLLEQNETILRFSLNLDQAPPERFPAHFIIGVCRPQTIKKVVQFGAAIGLQSVHFVKTDLSDKSYLQSTSLLPENLVQEMWLSLEQVGDTIMPEVFVHRHWKEFYDQELSTLLEANREYRRILATPGKQQLLEKQGKQKGMIAAIGPEPGWSPAEIERYSSFDFKRFSLGPRQLRIEHAVEVICGYCLPLCECPTRSKVVQ